MLEQTPYGPVLPTAPSIFIIEDSPDIQESLKQLFDFEGYQSEVASNGQEALEILTANADKGIIPDLILLDLMMPIMDGPHFRQKQLELSDKRLSEIPVVVMTADGHIAEKSDKIGGKAFLKKPVDIDVLLNTVHRLCAS